MDMILDASIKAAFRLFDARKNEKEKEEALSRKTAIFLEFEI